MNERPKSKTPLLDLLDKLERDQLAPPDALRALKESPTDPKRLLRVLQEWAQREEQGARPRNFDEFQCLQPDTTVYPNAKQTSFKLFNLVLMLGDELPKMREYLVHSFQHGFDLQIDMSVPITRRKNKNPKQTPEEEMALQLSIETDFSLGYLYRATGREVDLILNSVFCVPKRQFGQDMPGKHRRVMHPKHANDVTDPDASTISYTTVLEAAKAAVNMQRPLYQVRLQARVLPVPTDALAGPIHGPRISRRKIRVWPRALRGKVREHALQLGRSDDQLAAQTRLHVQDHAIILR
jgi:hypothetical protein